MADPIAPGSADMPAWTGPNVTDQDASAWFKAQIGDYVLPGIASIEGFDRKQDVDIKKSAGKDGATLEDKGRVLAEGKIILEITAADWALAIGIAKALDPQQKGAVRQPRELVHPIPNALGVMQIYVRGVSIGMPSSVAGMVIAFDCVEWAPQPKPVRMKKQVEAPMHVSFDDRDSLRAWELAQASNAQITDSVSGLGAGLNEDVFEENTTERARVQRFPPKQDEYGWEE
jgi:hypothetical protein